MNFHIKNEPRSFLLILPSQVHLLIVWCQKDAIISGFCILQKLVACGVQYLLRMVYYSVNGTGIQVTWKRKLECSYQESNLRPSDH